ncbi:MAG: hypothetical protein H6751_12850 [Candidatus Omnitrophica bacterium]|nr:hypothetical protein [Candidatus Omnitrophota bacterium]
MLTGLENLDTLRGAELFKKVPESKFVFPFLAQLESLDFSGNLPTDYKSPTDWDLTFHLTSGIEYPLKIEVDPGKSPWLLSIDLSPMEFETGWLTALMPTPWGIPRTEGRIKLQEANLSGPMGVWSDWKAKIRADLNLPNVELPMIERTLSGVDLDLDFTASQDHLKGTSKVAIDKIATDVIEGGLRGFRSSKIDFDYSLKDGATEVSGPWSAADIWGSAYNGTLSLSSKTGYRVSAETEDLNWKQLPYTLQGRWKAKIQVEDNDFKGGAPQFEVSLDGVNFQMGELDFSSRPVTLRFTGQAFLENGGVRFEKAEMRWGDSLSLDLLGTEWNGSVFRANQGILQGDLTVLMGLIPNFHLDPRWERYFHPRNWRIEGGIEVQTEPTVTLEIQQGRLDTGKGIEGPIGFRYSQADRTWSFQAPTLRLNLAQLAREFRLPMVEISGFMTVQADFSGRIPGTGERGSVWLDQAIFDGEVSECDGRFNRLRADGGLDQHLFGWIGAGGRLSVDWNSASKRLSANIGMEDFIWYSKPADTDHAYPQQLRSGGARLSLNLEQEGVNRYQVKKFLMAWGKDQPVELGASGTVEKKGEVWLPNLNLRIQGNRCPKTAVFRGVLLEGSGIFLGTIGGNDRGNWILNGKATLDDLTFEHIVAPVILSDARGTFEVIDFRLDEYLSEARWNARPHRNVPEFGDTNIVAKAFQVSQGTPPNLIVPRLKVGTNVFERVALRTVREGEFLYMNTASGQFAEGGFPVKMTGYFFFHPRDGVAYRVAGYTERAPLGIALPMIGSLGLDRQAVEVRFYIVQDLFQEEVQTRYINLGIPIGMLKDIPGFGPALFGWTPDSLQSREIIVRKVGDGEWTVLNPLKLGDAMGIPEFILRDIPTQALEQTRDAGEGLIQGIGEGVRDFLNNSGN